MGTVYVNTQSPTDVHLNSQDLSKARIWDMIRAAPALRLAARQPLLLTSRRGLSTTKALRAEAEPVVGVEKVEVVQPKKPIGGFRGG